MFASTFPIAFVTEFCYANFALLRAKIVLTRYGTAFGCKYGRILKTFFCLSSCWFICDFLENHFFKFVVKISFILICIFNNVLDCKLILGIFSVNLFVFGVQLLQTSCGFPDFFRSLIIVDKHPGIWIADFRFQLFSCTHLRRITSVLNMTNEWIMLFNWKFLIVFINKMNWFVGLLIVLNGKIRIYISRFVSNNSSKLDYTLLVLLLLP